MEALLRVSRKRMILIMVLCALLCQVNCVFCLAKEAQKDVKADPKKDAQSAQEQKLISITLKETDLREVLNILAFKGGVNIVAGDDVDSKISVQLKDVPWEQALDVILKTYNYTYKKEGNLIRVMSLARALEEEGKVPLQTKILPLNFADVGQLKASLDKMLSKRGTIEVDTRTNSLIITDIPEMVYEIEKAALNLDTLTPQVLIEAMMVDVKITDDNQWGSVMNILDLKTPNSRKKFTSNFSNSLTEAFTFGTTNDFLSLDGVLEMMVEQQLASILANPKVLTLDNQEAMIEIISEIPYEESFDSGGVITKTTKFKEAGIKLSVTPHITSGRYISMNVQPEQSFQSGFVEGSTQPIIDKRKAETNLLVKDGQTIVIGGLRQTTDNTSIQKFPFFGDIPVVGLFFRGRVSSKVQTELVLFVTPHIIDAAALTDRDLELYNRLDNTKRLEFDDRTEMQRIKDFFASKEKAEVIAQQETKRFRMEREDPEQDDIKAVESEAVIVPMASVPPARYNFSVNNPEPAPPAAESTPVLIKNDELEIEARKFRQSLEMMKREY